MSCEQKCGYILKLLIILLACVGIACSFYASNDCEFLHLASETSDATDIFVDFVDNETEGWIGIFKYEPPTNNNQDYRDFDECSYYENFFIVDSPNNALLASQVCAVLAPGLAFVAILISTIELLCCRFIGSFVFASVLFLTASMVQSGTFVILLTDQDVCFDPEGCSIGKAAYVGASSIFCYFSACILLCCSPRPAACMQKSRKKRSGTVVDDGMEAPQ